MNLLTPDESTRQRTEVHGGECLHKGPPAQLGQEAVGAVDVIELDQSLQLRDDHG